MSAKAKLAQLLHGTVLMYQSEQIADAIEALISETILEHEKLRATR